MKLHGWKQQLARLAFGLAAALALPLAARGQELEIEVEAAPPALGVVADHLQELRGIQPSTHWIGVVVRPCDEVLRKHLKLDGGLVIDDVSPDSPAAKAGIEKHDILLMLNETSVADLSGLMEFLGENKEKVIVVKVLHGGEAKSVEVAPVERPQDQFKFFPDAALNIELSVGKLPEELQRWMKEFAHDPEKLRAWRGEGEPLRARFFHPGVLLGDKAKAALGAVAVDLPDNVQVLIRKEGDKPAKITVKRGDESWEVTEAQLDKLPEDLRPHLQKFLGPADHLGIRVEPPQWTVPLDAAAPRVKIFAAPRAVAEPVRVEARAVRVVGPNLDKRLDEINSRLERIEKALEKLQ